MPVRVVPVRGRDEGLRELQVDAGTAAPVDGAERRLEPHVVPVSVARHALDLDVDAGLLHGLLVEHARVRGAREGALRHLQGEVRAAGLLPKEGGLVRIIGVGRGVLGEILVGRPDRRVVADRRVALVDGVDDLLPVDAVFQRHAGVVRRIGGVVAQGHEGEAVARALGLQHVDPRRFHHEADGLGVEPVDGVDLAGHERLGAGRGIRDVAQLDAVEPAAAGLPVVAGVLGEDAHAGLEAFQRVGAGAVGFGEVREAVGHHEDVVVRQVVGQIGVARRQGDLDLVGAELLDVLDGAEQVLRGRLGLAAMQVQRIDDVVGVERLARMEGHALADVEDPLGGAGLGFPGLEEFARSVAVLVDLDEAVPDLVAVGDRHGIRVGARIEAVRGAAALHAEAQRAALLGGVVREGGAAHRGEGEAERACARQEFAAVQDEV